MAERDQAAKEMADKVTSGLPGRGSVEGDMLLPTYQSDPEVVLILTRILRNLMTRFLGWRISSMSHPGP